MNKPKSEDLPSRATMIGRIVSSIIPILLFSIGWPGVVIEACSLLWKTGSTIGPIGDVGELVTFTWNMWVGLCIGIQLGTNIFCRLQGRRRRHNPWQFALVLLSALCIPCTIFVNDEIFTAVRKDNFAPKIWDLLVILIILAPVVAWFLFNFLRLVKKDHLLGPFLSS